MWCPQQESNLQLALRRGSLYPFNYGDFNEDIIRILAVSISTGMRDCLISRQSMAKSVKNVRAPGIGSAVLRRANLLFGLLSQ